MTDLNTLRASLDSGAHALSDPLAFIASAYHYQPQAFSNATVYNAAGLHEALLK
ncbi:HopJ type III effector protein, partial [Pseudomonas gessardii]|nr:HopJ type III effector protein [Pseudomonas gessardii]